MFWIFGCRRKIVGAERNPQRTIEFGLMGIGQKVKRAS